MAAALGRVLRLPGPPRLTVAGRTDAGVHARGQVIHVDVPAAAWAATAGRAVARLAGVLPADARFSALWRRYSYRVCDDPAAADPLRRHETLWYFRRLDVAAMNAAALSCLGEHDFAAFCRRRAGASTIRSLRTLDWHRDDDGVAVATVVADAFCHNMVRSLVGALLAVGEGRRPAGWPAEVLAAAVRDPAVRVVAPHGLCLEEVGYPRRVRWPLGPPTPEGCAPPAAREGARSGLAAQHAGAEVDVGTAGDEVRGELLKGLTLGRARR